jgi:hypothetical protein
VSGPRRRWWQITWPQVRPGDLFDVATRALEGRSNRQIMLEAARLLEAYGGQIDLAIAAQLRVRALLLGEEGSANA